jgi:hypothetical protein
MKKLALVLLFGSFVAAFAPSACKCKKDNMNNEANLVVETNPASNSVEPAAPGPDFPLLIKIKSTMPPSGVKIEITAKEDGSSVSAYFEKSENKTTADNTFTITNTPKGVTCVVNMKVTSLSKPTNLWTGSYKYSRK